MADFTPEMMEARSQWNHIYFKVKVERGLATNNSISYKTIP